MPTSVGTPEPKPGAPDPPAAAPTEYVSYLSRAELRPFDTPPGEAALAAVLGHLVGSDWAAQFAALDDVRRFAAFAPGVLTQGAGLRGVVAAARALAESPRSTLAKNGLRCLGELFVGCGAALNAELEACLATCVKRASDASRFITDEAHQAVREICGAAPEGHLLGQLLRLAGHKIPASRSAAMWGLAMLAQRMRGSTIASREAPGMAQAVVKAMRDPSQDVRQSARGLAAALMAWDRDGGRLGALVGREPFRVLCDAVPAGLDLEAFDASDRGAIGGLGGTRKTGGPAHAGGRNCGGQRATNVAVRRQGDRSPDLLN